ncbi:threonine/serine exporter ThrE family protein [Streptomyces sp. NPDC059009]|uniref:threonine/serine ThrE exporter family protein n=1 Tax=Streptomyces sp. NPDC059009 TaxID=3346694 RepID=UPI0036C19046
MSWWRERARRAGRQRRRRDGAPPQTGDPGVSGAAGPGDDSPPSDVSAHDLAAALLKRLPPLGADTIRVPRSEDLEPRMLQELAATLSTVGMDLVRAAERTAQIESTIKDIAARYGVAARCFAVPTGVFVRVAHGPGSTAGIVDFAPVEGPDLRLDQVQALQLLVERMRREPVPLPEVRGALREVDELTVRFNPAARVLGYALLTVGLGVVRHPTVPAIVGYAVLGVLVGLLHLLGDRFPAIRSGLPVAAAVLVTVVAQRWAGPVLHEAPTNLFIPPLIAFLPGASLTLGVIELAAGAVLSGMARLAKAGNVLLLLAFGILVGTTAVGARPVAEPYPDTLGRWAPWCALLLLGLGFQLFRIAPPRVIGWLVGALFLARFVQSLGTTVLGPAFGAFAAGMLLPPMAAAIQRRTSTPDRVIFLPCFWMLVPGSTGLLGVSELFVQHNANSVPDLITTTVTVAAIALGVLVGAGLLQRPHLELATAAPPGDSRTPDPRTTDPRTTDSRTAEGPG